MAKVCLVSCVSAKQFKSARAEDMYISPLFRGARFFAESRFDRWYILSAKYGLIEPAQWIEPYEKTLKKMPKKDRMHWAEKVINAITLCLNTDDVVGFIAGNDYREFLLPMLSKLGFAVEVPLEGLPIGKQLSWFKKNRPSKSALLTLISFTVFLPSLKKGLAESVC